MHVGLNVGDGVDERVWKIVQAGVAVKEYDLVIALV
jgi:hypothetical protein